MVIFSNHCFTIVGISLVVHLEKIACLFIRSANSIVVALENRALTHTAAGPKL